VGKDTLYSYLSYLEDAFLVRIVSIATDSERQRMVNPRKVYPIDMGLIPVFDRSRKANIEHALETAVYLELERRGAEVSYVKTASSGYEVDFLARYPDGSTDLIQVCASLEDSDIREREVRALVEAVSKYPRASLHIVALNPGTREDVPPTIQVHPAAAWLLAERVEDAEQ
jgi:predicted AAA+ superfamily ATPase